MGVGFFIIGIDCAKVVGYNLVMEKDVVKVCLEWLNYSGIFAWRNNTGAFTINDGGRKRFMRFSIKGASDIFGILPDGKFLAVECKGEKGKLSIDQEIFLNQVNGRNAVGIVAHSLDELIKSLEKYGYKNTTRQYK